MRKSNMELLRIVAMLMVLLLHATFETMHYPSPKLVQAAPDSWLGIILTNQACLCCVDVFLYSLPDGSAHTSKCRMCGNYCIKWPLSV